MRYIRDNDQPLEVWRDGVTTRMFVSALTGAHQLTMFEQWCEPRHGAPLHVHAVEEVLRVLDGSASITVGDADREVSSGESVIIPAGVPHGFVNTTDGVLHTLAVLASPIFEVHYLQSGQDQRRWQPLDSTTDGAEIG